MPIFDCLAYRSAHCRQHRRRHKAGGEIHRNIPASGSPCLHKRQEYQRQQDVMHKVHAIAPARQPPQGRAKRWVPAGHRLPRTAPTPAPTARPDAALRPPTKKRADRQPDIQPIGRKSVLFQQRCRTTPQRKCGQAAQYRMPGLPQEGRPAARQPPAPPCRSASTGGALRSPCTGAATGTRYKIRITPKTTRQFCRK